MKKLNSTGFTIIELMIATTVLSVVLLLATLIITSVGRLYTKGINQANVQSSARTIIDDIAQNLELSNGKTNATPGPNGEQGICINNIRYSFVVGQQVNANGYVHVLWRDTNSGAGCTAANLKSNLTNGTELIPSNSRLTVLSIPDATSPYTITVGVAYGDTDLLTTNAYGDASCRSTKGSEFCGAATLHTTVVTRLH
jgi:prepilin-type N-terminal cleavage/methylation domain-containing protein